MVLTLGTCSHTKRLNTQPYGPFIFWPTRHRQKFAPLFFSEKKKLVLPLVVVQKDRVAFAGKMFVLQTILIVLQTIPINAQVPQVQPLKKILLYSHFKTFVARQNFKGSVVSVALPTIFAKIAQIYVGTAGNLDLVMPTVKCMTMQWLSDSRSKLQSSGAKDAFLMFVSGISELNSLQKICDSEKT